MALAPARLGYVHVARGEIVANGRRLVAGDAMLYQDEAAVKLAEGKEAEVLVFDLPRI
ncbi:MAG: hypothetical protein ABWZ08_07505 [Pseudoxanthomonas sp.]